MADSREKQSEFLSEMTSPGKQNCTSCNRPFLSLVHILRVQCLTQETQEELYLTTTQTDSVIQ